MHDDGADHAWFIFNLYTKILHIFIFTYHPINYLDLTPFVARNKEMPSYLEGLLPKAKIMFWHSSAETRWRDED
jgi:hypothetical protein